MYPSTTTIFPLVTGGSAKEYKSLLKQRSWIGLGVPSITLDPSGKRGSP